MRLAPLSAPYSSLSRRSPLWWEAIVRVLVIYCHPVAESFAAAAHAYDDQLATAEAIVLVYPVWWYGMPAMLKGYFDRVWLLSVAFDVTPDGRVLTERLQRIRRIIVVTTHGGS